MSYRNMEEGFGHGSAAADCFGNFALSGELRLGPVHRLHTVQHASAARGQESYVLKRLAPELLHDPEYAAMLLQGAQLARGVSSPHLVRVLELGTRPEPYVLLEYVDGVSLEALCAQGVTLEGARVVVTALLDALTGLTALHAAGQPRGASGLIHQAPTARHILVGRDGVAKLTDYAQLTARGTLWSQQRERRLRASEMAPEQALAPEHLDARVDVFIAGITLWQALTGKLLFSAETRDASLQRVLRVRPPLPSQVAPWLGTHFDGVCTRALARSRTERYADAAELLAELRACSERAGFLVERSELAHAVDAATPRRNSAVRPAAARTLIGFAVGDVKSALESKPVLEEVPLLLEAKSPAPLSTIKPARSAGPRNTASNTLPLRYYVPETPMPKPSAAAVRSVVDSATRAAQSPVKLTIRPPVSLTEQTLPSSPPVRVAPPTMDEDELAHALGQRRAGFRRPLALLLCSTLIGAAAAFYEELAPALSAARTRNALPFLPPAAEGQPAATHRPQTQATPEAVLAQPAPSSASRADAPAPVAPETRAATTLQPPAQAVDAPAAPPATQGPAAAPQGSKKAAPVRAAKPQARASMRETPSAAAPSATLPSEPSVPLPLNPY